jgi:hypothetical protein
MSWHVMACHGMSWHVMATILLAKVQWEVLCICPLLLLQYYFKKSLTFFGLGWVCAA